MKLIGIAGGSGSGKTTFAKKVFKFVNHEGISLLHMDSYYLSPQPEELLTASGKKNFDHPEAFDWKLLEHDLSELKEGRNVESPVYDFKTNSRTSETRTIQASQVLLFEGIFPLFKPEIRQLLDIKCYLFVDSDIRFTRRLHRDVNDRGRSLESVIAQYYETVRPMHQKYIEPQKQYADFIVGEETDAAADILSAKIKEYLK